MGRHHDCHGNAVLNDSTGDGVMKNGQGAASVLRALLKWESGTHFVGKAVVRHDAEEEAVGVFLLAHTDSAKAPLTMEMSKHGQTTVEVHVPP